MTDVFRVLHVCTGNICRSPMAERLMRSGLHNRLGAEAERFVVTSAGTWGHSGAPMEAHALTVLADFGVDGSDFRARELVADHVREADLVLTATREHRGKAVVLLPRASSRTFTLREFARLSSAVDPAVLPDGDVVARARALVAAAAGKRGLVPPATVDEDDLADPYKNPLDAFDACADLVAASLRGPLDLLAGVAAR